MKNLSTLISLILSCTVVFGQQIQVLNPSSKSNIQSNVVARPDIGGSRLGCTGAAIWSDDFSNASTWVIDHDPFDSNLDWEIGIVGTGGFAPIDTIQSTTQSNGYAMVDSDEYGGENGGTEIEDSWITTADSIDLSGQPNVILQFETWYRRWNYEACYVVVSTDGVTWPDLNPDTDISGMPNVWNVFEGLSNATSLPNNPSTVHIDISAVAGNQSQVWIRFNWTGTWGYSWFVDDVKIIEQPQNDVSISDPFFSHVGSDRTQYHRILQGQVGSSIDFSSFAYNWGQLSQSTVTLDVDVQNSATATVASAANNVSNLGSAQQDVISMNVGVGSLPSDEYTVYYSLSSTGDVPAGPEYCDNEELRKFRITDNVYSADGLGIHDAPITNDIGTNSFTDAEDGFMMFTLYDILDPIEVNGLEIVLAPGTVAGGSLIVAIHDSLDIANDNVYDPLEQSDVIDITQAHVDAGSIFVPFDDLVSLPVGVYYAGVELFSNDNANDIRIMDDITVYQPQYTSSIYIPNDQVYTNGTAFAIRLKTCSSIGATNVTECDSYEWNGSVYTSSGIYGHVNLNGDCETIDLTILESPSTNMSFDLCAGESVNVNGTVYSTTGQYTQNFTAQNTCDSTITIDVNVETAPSVSILGNTNISPNSAETYAFVNPGGYTIIWSATNGTILGGQGTTSVDIFWDATGGGQIILTLDNGNCSYSDTVDVGTFVSIENHWINDLQIHPNPSSGIFNMELTEATVITVLDSRGRMIVETNGNGRYTLDLSAESTGTYTLQLRTETGIGVQRLVKY